jgi:hypothetical protein
MYMETDSAKKRLRHALLRMALVLCSTLGFGFLFFRSAVFDMRTMASQFLTGGVSAGISYAASKNPRRWDGYGALFLWYVVLTFFVGQFEPSRPAAQLVSVAGIGGAVSVYCWCIRRGFVLGPVQRVAAAGLLTGAGNALIVIILGVFPGYAYSASLGLYASVVFRNIQFGTLLGITIGIGAEIAEYLIRASEGGKKPSDSGD